MRKYFMIYTSFHNSLEDIPFISGGSYLNIFCSLGMVAMYGRWPLSYKHQYERWQIDLGPFVLEEREAEESMELTVEFLTTSSKLF